MLEKYKNQTNGSWIMEKTELTSPSDTSYCGTSYAAKRLGLSVGTVQKLVETNKLLAWKTEGGHRRISLQSIFEYQKKNDFLNTLQSADEKLRQVLIVEDDENTRKMYEAYFDKWSLPLDVVIYSSAMDALVDLHFLKPSVLLTDLHMENMNGFEFISAIRKNKSFSSLLIIAITGLTDENIRDQGGLASDVLVLKKPIDMEWFNGFLQGVLSIHQ